MSETKWTDGPWAIRPNGMDFDIVNQGGDAELGNWLVAPKVRWLSNAHLIAAAPELYGELACLVAAVKGCWGLEEYALRSLLSNTNYNIVRDRLERAAAALKKARGQA